VSSRRLAESAATYLRDAIFAGEMAPGTRIRLRHTAQLLGMSEMPVRDALRTLEAEQLVTSQSRRGAKVAALSPDDIEELYAMRSGLEGLAAKVAVPRIDRETIAGMEDAFNAMLVDQASGDSEAFAVHDRLFHRLLYEASGRPGLVKRILDLWDNSWRSVPLGYRSWLPAAAAVESHRILLAAVVARNQEAAERFTREHTDQAASRILQAMAGTASKKGSLRSDRNAASFSGRTRRERS
jgi:DNA-binding GntR family transcriptional regulator